MNDLVAQNPESLQVGIEPLKNFMLPPFILLDGIDNPVILHPTFGFELGLSCSGHGLTPLAYQPTQTF